MYSSPKALEMAVKEAAIKSPLATSRAIAGFYFHRLLYRVFSEPDTPFVLKGGFGMLARTINARATRDIDLATDNLDIEDAVAELRRLAAKNAGDFVTFRFIGVNPIKGDDEYRDGYTLTFEAILGAKMIQRVSVDLVSDEISIGEPDWVKPADRIEVGGIEVCDYPVYPAERGVADKVCAIRERHADRPSTRVKDLLDIAVYALTEEFEAENLRTAILRETAARHIVLGREFELPLEWGQQQAEQYVKLAAKTNLPETISTIEKALELVKQFLNPIIAGDTVSHWNHAQRAWAQSTHK